MRVVGWVGTHALAQHLLQGRGTAVLLQEVAKRFISEFLYGDHSILRQAVKRIPRASIELYAPSNARPSRHCLP
jgi:hypothetical protein